MAIGQRSPLEFAVPSTTSLPDGCCVHGFRCTTGWDAVTGLGTPNYRQLKAMLP